MLGKFLELTLRAPRILDSWQFYQRLGFTPATVGEAWSHGYAVVTDGRISIGLHDAGVPHPALAFVRPDLLRHLQVLEGLGVEFESRVLGDDQFNEATFEAPDGQLVRLLEARTFSPPPRPPMSALGWFEEYALPVADLERARDGWERLGFVAAAESDEPWPHLALTSDTLDLGLYRTRAIEPPTLIFECDDLVALRERLAAAGIEPERSLPKQLDARAALLVEAPEGTRLLARTRDASRA
jgi:hypothetical protein